MSLAPLVQERPDRFKRLLEVLDNTLAKALHKRASPRDWFPFPSRNPFVQKDLDELTETVHMDKDQQFANFHRGRMADFSRDSADHARITAAWPKRANEWNKGVDLKRHPLCDDGSDRSRWSRKCLTGLAGESDQFGRPGAIPRNWRAFEVYPANDNFPETPFPDSRHKYPGIAVHMNILLGFWWHDKEDEDVRKAIDTLHGRLSPEKKKETEDEREATIAWAKETNRDGYYDDLDDHEDGELFEVASAHPNRIMLLTKDEALPETMAQSTGFTYSEFCYAMTYMDFMQVSSESALLLITIFGNKGARITEVFWSKRETLIFQVQPVLDLSSSEIQEFDPANLTDPWRLVSWLCCEARY